MSPNVSVPYMGAGFAMVWGALYAALYVYERRSPRKDEAVAAVFLATVVLVGATLLTGLVIGVSVALTRLHPLIS